MISSMVKERSWSPNSTYSSIGSHHLCLGLPLGQYLTRLQGRLGSQHFATLFYQEIVKLVVLFRILVRHYVKTVAELESGQPEIALDFRDHLILLEVFSLFDVDEAAKEVGILAFERFDVQELADLFLQHVGLGVGIVLRPFVDEELRCRQVCSEIMIK